tara:strand:+ start:980 stop:1213 length:234 start_codon:yes stop_codon:yes gene_type:complete
MDYVLAAVFIVLVMYVFDKACLWLERKGWLNYSQTKKCNGKSVFSDLSDYMQPKHQTCKANGKPEDERPIPTRYYLE